MNVDVPVTLVHKAFSPLICFVCFSLSFIAGGWPTIRYRSRQERVGGC